MSDESKIEPLGNDSATRDPTGEIKNQSSTPPELSKTDQTTETSESKDPTQAITDKAEGAPDKYADFTVPEGYKLDETVAGEAGTLFKELGLPQAAAQQLVDFYIKQTQEAFAQPMKAYEEMRAGWRNDVANDKDLGNGTDLKPEVKAILGRMIESMGAAPASAFREAMDLTGAGDNPAIIRGLVAVAKLMTEGSFVRGAGPAPVKPPNSGPKSAASALFPNLPSSAS